MMIDRIAAEVKEKTGGRIDIQGFPNGQLGSGKDMMEAVASGALTMTTDGAAALGAFLPALSVIEAPYLWRDAAHMAKVAATPIFDEMNADLVAKRGMRDGRRDLLRQAPPYHRQRNVKTRRRHGGLQAARAAGRHLPRDGRGLGRAGDARQLQRTLSRAQPGRRRRPGEPAADDPERASSTRCRSTSSSTGHIITPRLVIVNERVLDEALGRRPRRS